MGCHETADFNAFMGSKFQTDSKCIRGVDGRERRQSQYSKQSFAYLCACVGLIEDRQSSSDHQAKLLEDQTYLIDVVQSSHCKINVYGSYQFMITVVPAHFRGVIGSPQA